MSATHSALLSPPPPPLGLRMTPGEIELVREQQRFEQLRALEALPYAARDLELARLRAASRRELAALDLAEAELLADSPLLHPSIQPRAARVATAYQLNKLAAKVGLDASFLAQEAYLYEGGTLSLGADTVVALVTHVLGDRLVRGFRVELSEETRAIPVDVADPHGLAVAVPARVTASCQIAGEEVSSYIFTADDLALAPWAREDGILKPQYRTAAALQMGRRAKVRLIRSVPALHMASQGLGHEGDPTTGRGSVAEPAQAAPAVVSPTAAADAALDRIAARADAAAARPAEPPAESSARPPSNGPAMPNGGPPAVSEVMKMEATVGTQAMAAARYTAGVARTAKLASLPPDQLWQYAVELDRQMPQELRRYAT